MHIKTWQNPNHRTFWQYRFFATSELPNFHIVDIEKLYHRYREKAIIPKVQCTCKLLCGWCCRPSLVRTHSVVLACRQDSGEGSQKEHHRQSPAVCRFASPLPLRSPCQSGLSPESWTVPTGWVQINPLVKNQRFFPVPFTQWNLECCRDRGFRKNNSGRSVLLLPLLLFTSWQLFSASWAGSPFLSKQRRSGREYRARCNACRRRPWWSRSAS